MDEQQQKKSEELQVLKMRAVRQAMFEVVGESRDEIVRRARAKLVAMGVQLSDDEVGGLL